MKATVDSLTKEYHESGVWSDVPLDELFKTTAAQHPDRLALVDAPDRAAWTGGEPRRLTYAEADREIDRLAAFYNTVGLSADHVIGVQAPNTVDTVIAVLAALRADLIVSPLPLHWRQKNVLEALNSIGAKGFIAADRVETRDVGTAARDVAADLFSLRFVFGLGKDVPDGLIELGPMLAEMGDGLSFVTRDRPDPADHTATICWSRSGEENVPVSRCHNHWISAAQMIVNEAEISENSTILVPYSLSGLTGLGAGLVPFLMTGSTLHLHHPTSLANLATHANDVEADIVMTPGPLAQTLDRKLGSTKTTVLAAWNISAPHPTTFVARRRLVDVHIADEFALVARARGPSAKIKATALGKHNGSIGCENRPALLEIAVTEEGEAQTPTLLVKGPMVPEIGWRTINGERRRVRWEGTGYLKTNIKVDLVDDGIAGFGIPGSYALGTGNLETIDVIYSSYPGIREAAAFIVEDPVLGARMYAALVPETSNVPDAASFFAFLDADGVDLAKIPHRVLILQSLPRNADGTICREKLTMRTQRLPAAVA
ncbi:AMP-binding protein [Roseibium album]|uniref:Short-chain-fatty-acid--CoA ligase n=1 Tax=Roseibium album TaxID=311410 RepID=A0A0M7AU93_9HYPH|nr:class I adenylate-forming enzyme family protein [Roseibium album]CTQ62370.1 Short-chain-fatty-acid--CoA ligase [Roseibium album]CTQ77976.1 Short-chain-fatty-acid--CoA ligase [Roseibium album]CTQ80135.1 Short-chain-fatty-acid--CoA ligase [Roseibium album]